MAGEAHDPAHPLHDEVVRRPRPARPVLSESRDAAEDRAPVEGPNAAGREPEPLEGPGAEVLDDDVGALDKPLEDLLPIRVLEIQRDAPLVAVDREVVRGDPADLRRRPFAGLVALSGLLDLHDVGAVVREHERAVRTRKCPRQIDHT